MSFFNESLDNNNDNNQTQNENNTNKVETVDNQGNELEFNKKNREDYETLMKESSTQLDGYWDSNNPFVRIILLILGVVIVGGSIFYIMTYLGNK